MKPDYNIFNILKHIKTNGKRKDSLLYLQLTKMNIDSAVLWVLKTREDLSKLYVVHPDTACDYVTECRNIINTINTELSGYDNVEFLLNHVTELGNDIAKFIDTIPYCEKEPCQKI